MTYSPEEMLLSLIPTMLHDQAREYIAELGGRAAVLVPTATCDASTAIPGFNPVGPCLKPPGHAPADPWHQDEAGCRWRECEEPPAAVELTPEQLARVAMDGVYTPGCDCEHDGMGVSWHRDWCAWRTEQR